MLDVILKMPRIEKFNIGNEYKSGMYQMLEEIIYINRTKEKELCLNRLNHIDCKLLLQRIYLRIMMKNHWIDERKFEIAMDKIAEIGKIVGGLMKYYGKVGT